MTATEPLFDTLGLGLVLDPDLACQSPLLQAALDHWRLLRGSRAMPAARDLDALLIPREVLPHVSLVDIEEGPDRRFRWRLIGTGVTAALQRDMSGCYWDEIYGADIYNLFAQPANAAIQSRAPMRFTARAHVAGREIYDAEHIYMPLADESGRVGRLFGISIFSYAARGG